MSMPHHVAPFLKIKSRQTLQIVPQAMPLIRDLCVRKVDLLRHGFTEGCGKCDAIRAGFPSPISHTSRCRARITEALGQDDPRVQRVRERFERYEVDAEQHPVELEPPPKELELPDEISAQEESEVEDDRRRWRGERPSRGAR